jgi:hypothetical protein
LLESGEKATRRRPVSYEFIEARPSGNGSDVILKVRRRPSWWDTLLGRDNGEAAFFGPRSGWITMDGRTAPRGVQRALDAIWEREHGRTQSLGVEAWNRVEPPTADDQQHLAGRATSAARP